MSGACFAPLALPDDEAHVWYAWTAPCDSARWREASRSLLNAEEEARLQRFAFDYLKLEYLVTRAVCRTTLSRYAPVAPAQWCFAANAYGRPEIAMGQATPALRFNLSNARSLVACVITRGCDAGIDVEEIERRGETLGIADRFFSPTEVRALQSTAPQRQQRRFFEFWTLKESYIKARGMGLSIPLEKFSFDVEARPIRIDFDLGFEDTPEDWQFELFEPGAGHLMAVGLRRGRAADFRVKLHALQPCDLLPGGFS